MTQNALEQLAVLEREFEQKKQEIRQAAVSELVKEIAKAKERLEELQNQYALLTGKDLRGNTVSESGTRKRLSKTEQESLKNTLLSYLQANPGSKMGDLVKAGGESTSATRKALLALREENKITSKGEKANTVYSKKD
jgi:hypothetical protein